MLQSDATEAPQGEVSAPELAELVLAFLNWANREHGAKLYSPGYGGDMLQLGPDRELVDEFLKEEPKIHAVPWVRKI